MAKEEEEEEGRMRRGEGEFLTPPLRRQRLPTAADVSAVSPHTLISLTHIFGAPQCGSFKRTTISRTFSNSCIERPIFVRVFFRVTTLHNSRVVVSLPFVFKWVGG